MTRIATTLLLLLALAGCVDAMPLHDENNRILNSTWHADAYHPWAPRMLIE